MISTKWLVFLVWMYLLLLKYWGFLAILIAEEITAAFRRFGPLVVDWPHKAESKSYFPPKGEPGSIVEC